jgi:protein SCO1
VATLLLAGCAPGEGSAGPSSGPTSAWRGTAISNPYPLPEQRFSDTAGDPVVPARDAAEDVTLVFFGYTHCPDICQVVMSTIAGAVSRLDDAQRAEVEVVFVTTDPARDTGPVLRRYLDRFDPDFVGLTGDLSRIMDLAKPLGVFLAKGQELPSGGYEVDHTTHVFGVTGDQARLAWPQGTAPAAMAADIIKLLTS